MSNEIPIFICPDCLEKFEKDEVKTLGFRCPDCGSPLEFKKMKEAPEEDEAEY